ncbi:hypothetical protein [Microlunatus flavus]|uniref:Uncharacterized protein n=1 Tax=Microlunatus flavus TaxID=1036181 RepID=A0A1H9GCG0_9ACTN|nr:hypothetical protein [Microlunatus flavus]SEQ47845.1 hypothetical protein SAMN05421756_103584 [Microlunatus flavus]
MRRARLVLGGVGVAVLLYGVWTLADAVLPASYAWLVVWLLGAVVLHDLVVAPVLVGLRWVAHRVLGALPPAALAVLLGAGLLCGLLVLVVAPMLWAQHLGPANPTVLPGAYGLRLVVSVLVLALVGALPAVVVVRGARRRRH